MAQDETNRHLNKTYIRWLDEIDGDGDGSSGDHLRHSGAGLPDALVVDHDAKFTSKVFRALVKSMGSCLIVGSAYHKNTNAKVERANGVISDTLRASARTTGTVTSR